MQACPLCARTRIPRLLGRQAPRGSANPATVMAAQVQFPRVTLICVRATIFASSIF